MKTGNVLMFFFLFSTILYLGTYGSEEKTYDSTIGTKVVIDKDTTTIIDYKYYIFDDYLVTSNNKNISILYYNKFKVK